MPKNDNTPTPATHIKGLREHDVVRTHMGSQDQLHEIQAKLGEEQKRLIQLRQVLEQETVGQAPDEGARVKSCDVYRRIVEDAGAEKPLVFNRASQNLAAVAILLRIMPEPSTTEVR
jgi:hypothetical protein